MKTMLQFFSKRKNKKGFTLVEVIIVLVILAIIAAVAIPSLTGYIDKANKSKYMLAARNTMQAMQTELLEMYGRQEKIEDIPKVASNSNGDVLLIGTDFAKKVLETADDDPYLLIIGTGDSKKFKDSERAKAYTVYFVAYWPDKNEDPIFFNGTEWVDTYPWKKAGANTFTVKGKQIPLQFYIVAGPNKKGIDANWNALQNYLKKNNKM